MGVVSDLLGRRGEGGGLAPVDKVLVPTAYVRDCIIPQKKPRLIHEAVTSGGTQYGMQSFDQSLYDLLQQQLISYETALENATNPDDFKLRCQGIGSTADAAREQMDTAKFGR